MARADEAGMRNLVLRAIGLVGPLVLVGSTAAACRPELDVPPRVDPVPDEAWHVETDPPPELSGAIPPVVQLRITGALAHDVDASSFVLVTGDVTEVQARYLESGRLTEALKERAIDARAFLDGEAVLLAPSVVLAPGPMTLVRIEEGVVARFDVADDALPRIVRVFPPSGGAPGALVYCGDVASEARFALLPGGPSGWLVPWVAGCVRFVPDGPPDPASASADATLVPWPRVAFAIEGARAVDPGPLSPADCDAAAPSSCEPEERGIGPVCLGVEDDRLHVRVAAGARLVAVEVADEAGHVVVSSVRALGGSAAPSLTTRGLSPSTRYTIRVRTVGCAGDATDDALGVVTSTLRDHLVLTEVLANPLGPEPDQEWVEIHNDGSGVVSLAAYTLADAGAAVAFPDATLEPGAYALVVDGAFDETAVDDVPPPAACVLLRLPSLGKNGLSNDGERVTLAWGGAEVSSMPASPRPQSGKTLARDDDGAFAIGAPTPCAPAAPTKEGAPGGTP